MANPQTPVKNTETKFKAVIYWKRNKSGQTFTHDEIKNKRNRVYLPSHDYVQSKDGLTITNHQQALKKLDGFLAKCAGKYYTALIILNSSIGEVLVRKYNDGVLVGARELQYKAHGKNLNDVVVCGISGNPLKLNDYNETDFNYMAMEQRNSPEISKQLIADNFKNIKKTIAEINVNTVHKPADSLRERIGTKNMNYAKNSKESSS
jgi:hypothetical protein